MTAPPPERPDTEDRGGASHVERWFLRVMLGVSVVAWSALLLAELGQLRLGLLAFLLAVAVIGFGLWGALRAVPPAPAAAGGVLRPALAAAAGVLVCAALFLPPYHTETAAGDATVYLNFGRQIARHGALEFEDPLLRQLSPASRAELFLNRVPGDVAWTVRVSLDGRPYTRFPGGLLIPDVAEPTVTAGFSPLFPVLAALGHALASPQGALVVAPLFATLSLIGLWCVARRLGGVGAAWLAAALTAVSLPQIWFAKVPLPEAVAQCFVLAGVLAWLVASARGAPRWAWAAGWFLGLACFAKVDLVVLLSVFLLAVAAVRLLGRARPDDPPLLLPLLAAFGLLVAHNLVHYLSFTSHYKPYVAYLIRTSEVLGLLRESLLLQLGVALAAGVLVAAGVIGLRRPEERWVRRLWGLAAAGGLVIYGAAYVTATTGRLDETIAWLGWYFSWPVLGLAALGLAASGLAGSGLVRRDAAPRGLVFAGLLLGVVGLQYLYDPLETGLQIGSMRRYVPVVLPLTMLFAALTTVGLLARVPAARYRTGLTLAAGALLVALVARPSLAVIGQPLWDDPLARVARMFPERAVVLMSPDLAPTHIPTSLAYLHDVDAILVQQRNPDGRVLRRVIGDWLARGRPVFLVVGREEFSFFAPDLALAAIGGTQIDLHTLETTRARVPRAAVRTPIPLRFFQVTGTIDRDRLDVDVGTPAVDLLYDLRGFHASEREGDASGGTFRWTGSRASLTLPAGGAVTLVVAGARPPGSPAAEIAVSVGERVLERRAVAGTPQPIRLDLPETAAAGPFDLEIESTTFQPRAFGSSPDPRELGVRLYGVLVHPPPAP
ncbi:MAG: hypothetical protein OXG04_00030 [Acidobacteria bacterium]|nr:hypothetical protein [Acidobacteriota bacterium]